MLPLACLLIELAEPTVILKSMIRLGEFGYRCCDQTGWSVDETSFALLPRTFQTWKSNFGLHFCHQQNCAE